VGALAAPSAGGYRLAAAVSAADTVESIVEEHRTEPEDAPRRAVLLAMNLLRGKFMA
jgi:hypothetical protein